MQQKIQVLTHSKNLSCNPVATKKYQFQPGCNWKNLSCNPVATEKYQFQPVVTGEISVAAQLQLKNTSFNLVLAGKISVATEKYQFQNLSCSPVAIEKIPVSTQL
jgi:hypothetical protein